MELTLGIDIGGTKVCLALVRRDGTIVDTVRYPLREGSSMPETLFAKTDAFLHGRTDINGIGVGLKGLIAADLRTIRSSSILKAVLPWDICTELSARYGAPCILDNDVHAATAAEMLFGAARGQTDFLYINVGTGTAVGMVSGGRLLRGASNAAGEVGMSLLTREGGALYDLESVASGSGLSKECARLAGGFDSPMAKRALQGEEITGKEISASEDPLALATYESAVQALAIICYNLSALLEPTMIVFGGGAAADGVLMKRTEKRLQSLYEQFGGKPPKLTLSSLGADLVGVLGAASVWMNHSTIK